MNSINKISQDLEFLSKLIRSSDYNAQIESLERYDNGADKCVPYNCFFRSELNLELIENLSQVFDTLSPIA